MGKVNGSNLLNVEQQMAYLASEAEIKEVIEQIADLFAAEGNPLVLAGKKLDRWENYLPRLVEEGALVKYSDTGRDEYELVAVYRRWIAPDFLVEKFKATIQNQSISKIQENLIRFGLVYGYNPGVTEALRQAYHEVLRDTSLAEFLRAIGSVRSMPHLRAALGDRWNAFVDQVRAAQNDDQVLSLLEGVGVIRYNGKEWRLKPRITDCIALAKAQTINDVEFILERLEVDRVER